MDDKVGSISTWVAKFDETEMAAFSSRQTIKIFTREHRGYLQKPVCKRHSLYLELQRKRWGLVPGGKCSTHWRHYPQEVSGPSPFSSSFPHSHPDLNACV